MKIMEMRKEIDILRMKLYVISKIREYHIYTLSETGMFLVWIIRRRRIARVPC